MNTMRNVVLEVFLKGNIEHDVELCQSYVMCHPRGRELKKMSRRKTMTEV